MKLEEQLIQRNENKCELCQSEDPRKMYTVPPKPADTLENTIIVCETCFSQMEKQEPMDKNHWRCLGTSMWSEVAAVQVVSWRLLNRLSNEGWAMDNLDMMYLDDELLEWAKATGDHTGDASVQFHKDSNGNILQTGDTVTLIKDLDVKGSTINAKVGTAVRNIRLVHDNIEQVEGKIDGQLIVILTKYVKKS